MSHINPDLYQMIHELVLAQPAASLERRERQRLPFDERQRIAQRREPGIPLDSEFHEVRCHDISQGGFSFLFPTRPKFRELVVAFGLPPRVIYVAAEIVHCTPVVLLPSGKVKRLSNPLPLSDRHSEKEGDSTDNDEEGQPIVLVGCRFVERLEPPA